ncbi:P3 protein [Protopterus annectens]|uniref:P3 protein n=1 Tax=Protopterus annectens TaxID=7888 RepID=UPI001CFABB38|nr:P3 protein [Protopterus annectens]
MKTGVLSLICGLTMMAAVVGTTVLPQGPEELLRIGDSNVVEFEFPERRRGIIVVNSDSEQWQDGWTLRVESLDPAVLRIENVSEGQSSGSGWQQGRSHIVHIYSGVAGTAPLLLQLLDLNPKDKPIIIAERTEFRIHVLPDAVPTPLVGDLEHFSEHPVLYVLLPLIFINKCAFGCKVDLATLKGLLKQPQPLLGGMLGQFVIMPLYGFALAKIIALPKALALGLVITCSAPGGGGGYLYSLLLGGDVTVAISMTLISTVVATGMMPLSSAIYSHLLQVHDSLHVPFIKILVTLLFIAVPISTGMFIKYKFPKVSGFLLLLIRPFSFLLIIGGLFMAYQMGAAILANVQPHIVIAGVTVPVCGLCVGYLLAFCLRLSSPLRRTVSIEVGVQNSLLALAVLQLSFQRADADFASQAPFLVALSSTSEMLLVVIVYLVYSKLCPSAGTS